MVLRVLVVVPPCALMDCMCDVGLYVGETYREGVKDILMGRGAMTTPRAKFHKAVDVATLFEGRPAPEQFLKTGWWHFLDVTVPGGERELLAVYNDTLRMFLELEIADFPITEEQPTELDEGLLEDLPRLWPPLQESK